VKRIFAEYLSGRGLYTITESLAADGIPYPSAADSLAARGTPWYRSTRVSRLSLPANGPR